ncbi:membrane-associating domain-containing protein [Lipomyces tetrasporus]|uniref:Membrane-associating domain-containing protein n=1 Tax=Lipomyces tetrasporus TaxID=54092 RepID=A0AAD7QSJ3_9ASCO|nr:membrane-associating domain-containing protein [Lipomyces tetrasporus]KAJ8100501.1 membrane-associating domain-containing protein [Lipomyces tetrasporus]
MAFKLCRLAALTYLRIAQVLLAILCLGLAAYTVSVDYDNDAGYLVFVSVWTFLAVGYLVFAPLYWSAAVLHKFVPFGVEILTNVFWFTGFIVMAAIYGPGSCDYYDGYDEYYHGYYYTTYYRHYSDYKTACGTSKAAIAFAAINWLLFVITTTLMAIALFRPRPAAGGRGDVEAAAAADGAGQNTTMSDAALGEKAVVGESAPPAASEVAPAADQPAAPAYSAAAETPAVGAAAADSEK